MKTALIFLGLVLSVGMARATNKSNTNPAKPSSGIFMESGTWSYSVKDDTDAGLGGSWEVSKTSWDYSVEKGGTWTYHFEAQYTNQQPYYSYDEVVTYDPNFSITSEHREDSDGNVGDRVYDFDSTFPREEGSLSIVYPLTGETQSKSAAVCMTLATGGRVGVQKNGLFTLTATAAEEWELPYFGVSGTNIPCDQISVCGKPLNASCVAFAVFPDNAEVDVTPAAGAPMYSFTVDAGKQCAPMRLDFTDKPGAPSAYYQPNGYTCDFQLVLVCSKNWGDTNPVPITSITWGYDVDANGVPHQHSPAGNGSPGSCGTIVVDSFTNYYRIDNGVNYNGVHLTAHYIGCCDDGDLRWVQYITAENPLSPGPSLPRNDVDPRYSLPPYTYGPVYIDKLYHDYADYEDWLNGLCP